eukprot:2253937-Rhodomonas_salina.1
MLPLASFSLLCTLFRALLHTTTCCISTQHHTPPLRRQTAALTSSSLRPLPPPLSSSPPSPRVSWAGFARCLLTSPPPSSASALDSLPSVLSSSSPSPPPLHFLNSLSSSPVPFPPSPPSPSPPRSLLFSLCSPPPLPSHPCSCPSPASATRSVSTSQLHLSHNPKAHLTSIFRSLRSSAPLPPSRPRSASLAFPPSASFTLDPPPPPTKLSYTVSHPNPPSACCVGAASCCPPDTIVVVAPPPPLPRCSTTDPGRRASSGPACLSRTRRQRQPLFLPSLPCVRAEPFGSQRSPVAGQAYVRTGHRIAKALDWKENSYFDAVWGRKGSFRQLPAHLVVARPVSAE